jgi:Tfp pilus assembly protein PilF
MGYGNILSSFVIILMLAGCSTGSSTVRPASYHYQMGVSYLEERNYTAALAELTEAEKSYSNVAELQYNLGRALMGRRRPDLAEPRFLKAIQLKPSYSDARNDLGVLYLETNRWDNAIQQFKAVKEDLFYPRHDHAAINLGLAYLGKG